MPIRRTVRSARDAQATASAILLLAAWAYTLPLARAQNESCAPQMARLVSLQGVVELRPAAKKQWERVKSLDTPLCKGDLLRTGANSRALLFIPSENLLRVDQKTTVSVHVQGDETIVEFFLDEASHGSACGAGYAISRFPRKFKVDTPFSHAAVEGTEFLVALSCTQATVSVFEGKVSVRDRVEQASQVVLGPGQTASVGPGQPPVVQVLVKPTDAVQWTLFYPPLADRQFGADPLHAPCETLARDRRPACLLGRAEALVSAGQIEQAQTDIRELLALEPNSGDAYALRSVISVAQNEKSEAMQYARQATKLSPNAPRPWLALSYAQQAQFALEPALQSAQKAAALAPSSGLVQARVAELLMSLGRVRDAERAARQAVKVDPKQSRGYVILGFVQLVQIDIRSARQSFNQAIELDSTDPLPRLGLGLAAIRDGKLEQGREQIEIAVALAPNDSLLRSYLGKAYFEENTEKRDRLAASQYSLAKELDPNDPTPWFYAAILEQTQNRPVQALENLDRSIELNDNRAVYRSRLLLDADLAARSTSLARIYDNLGFEQLGIVESTKSLGFDPTNDSAHRFLADTYAGVPRHEIARASELFQSQMLQPININPVQPSSAEVDLLVLPHTGPANPSFNEYTPLFESNGVQLNLTGAAGNHGILSDEIVFSGIVGRNSFSLGQYHYQSDGFRPNNDLTHDIYNAFYQVQISPEFSAQFEYRKRDTERGDLQLRFDPADFSTLDRQTVTLETPRVGLRFSPSPRSDILLSYVYSKRTENRQQLDQDVLVDSDGNSNGNDVQGQYIFRGDRFNATAGGGYTDVDREIRDTLDFTRIFGEPCPAFLFPLLGDCTSVVHRPVYQTYGYLYGNLTVPDNATWTLGVGYDDFQQGTLSTNQLSPKLGLRWNATPGLQVRLAYLETLKRELTIDQTLEPTQVAGFNQFYDDLNGTTSDLYGAALDATISRRIYAGLEFTQRRLNVPIDIFGTGRYLSEGQTQLAHRGYLYWTAGSRWAGSVEVQYEDIQRDPALAARSMRPDQISTLAVPAAIRYFKGSGRAQGLFAVLGATYVHQNVGLPPASTFPKDSEDFVTVDAAVGYRLPRRLGMVSLQVNNLFDQQFLFQDFNLNNAEPSNPRFAPSRTVVGRVFISF